MARYEAIVLADLRLAVLHCLDAAPAYRLAVHLLHKQLIANAAATSEADLRRELEWLQSAGLVIQLPDCVTLTQMGLDVAYGRQRAEGVRRLRPGELDALRGDA